MNQTAKTKKVFIAQAGGVIISLVLVFYFYRIIIAREMFDTFTFVLLLSLGTIAFLLNIKGIIEARLDVEKMIREE
jgi:multisubunit Na+/H+ antiporter MnhE subunit